MVSRNVRNLFLASPLEISRAAQQLMGLKYEAAGDPAGAVQIWRQTGNIESLKQVAAGAVERDDLGLAYDAYYAAWELDPSQGTGDLVTFLRREMKNPAAAEEVLWESLPDIPYTLRHYGWLTQLAGTLEEQERWADAARVYERSLALGNLYGQPVIAFYDYLDLHRATYYLAAAYYLSEQPAQAVQDLIKQTGGKTLREIRLFDVYRGDQLGEGKKSLAYSLVYQDPEKTLTDKEVLAIRNKIVKRLEKELGAQLRSW